MRKYTLTALLILAAALVVACNRQEPSSPADDPLATLVARYGEPMKTYQVRGQVETLPDPNRAGTDFRVKHEAIDDFVDQHGNVTGMHSMSMPFTLAEGVELPDGLEPGDKVLIHCAQWIEPDFRFFAYKVEQLPDDTELTYRRANPPADADGEGEPAEPEIESGEDAASPD